MLHILIAAGLVLGFGVGLLAAATGSDALMAVALASAPLGTIFMNAIRMVVIPLVMAVIFTGVARLGDLRKLGRLGGTTLGFYWITTPPAIVLGMATMTFFLRFTPEIAMPAVGEQAAPVIPGIVDFLVTLVPSNPFAAAAAGSLLPLIVFTALFGAAAAALGGKQKENLLAFADAVSATLIKLVWWVLWCAPVGVFGLAAPVTAQLGWDLVQSLAMFVAAVITGAHSVHRRGVPGAAALGGPDRPGSLRDRGVRGHLHRLREHQHGGRPPGVPPGGEREARGIGQRRRPGAAAGRVALPARQRALPGGRGGLPGPPVRGALPARRGRGGGAGGLPGRAHHRARAVGQHLHPGARAGRGGDSARRLGILLGIDRVPDMFRTVTNLWGQITTSVLVDRWAGKGGG